MTNLKQQILNEIKTALKAGEALKTSTLRSLITAINNREIEKGKEAKLTDEETLVCLQKEAKKRKESIEAFTLGNRADLANQEKKELAIIESYLPKQMTKEETETQVAAILDKAAAKDFGSAMKAAMAQLKGKADAKLVSEIVKSKFNG